VITVRLVLGIMFAILATGGYVAIFGIGHSTAMLFGPFWFLLLLILFVASLFASSKLVAFPDQRTKFNVSVVASSLALCVGIFLFIVANMR
jgi:hypothetical protein